jgi:restriction system protein
MTDDYLQLMVPWHQNITGLNLDDEPIEVSSEFMKEPKISRTLEEVETLVMTAHRIASESLRLEILGRIYAQNFSFFETMIIDVLLAMGYGARRRDMAKRLGRSGDGGVDGIIDQDELGLDVIYFQAKRLKPGSVVPISAVRDFAGSLEAHRAVKGVFVTTAHFSPAAYDFVQAVSRRVVLIDGTKLTDLMIRHNIGVEVRESYQFKRLDNDYFSPASFEKRTAETSSASSQPRR